MKINISSILGLDSISKNLEITDYKNYPYIHSITSNAVNTPLIVDTEDFYNPGTIIISLLNPIIGELYNAIYYFWV